MSLLRFLHFLGMALWLGGALALMVLRITARRETPAVQASVARISSQLHGSVVATGVLLTVLSGLALSMQLPAAMMGEAGMIGMQVSGLLAGILILFVAVPTALKIARVAVPSDTGDLPPIYTTLRRRLVIVSSIAGSLAIVALVCATLV